METKLYNQKGEEAGKLTLPESIFGLSWNGDLVHQVVSGMMSNSRIPYAHTKMRGEVSGGGKKPWRQKGTGRARHGSTRSPIWVGGGVTHGPRNDKNYTKKINKKMRAKALFTILSRKQKEGEILFVDSITMPEVKTKHAVSMMKQFAGVKGFERMPKKRVNSLYLVSPKGEFETIKRGFQNIGNLCIDSVENLNPLDLLKYKYLVLSSPFESFKSIEGRMTVVRNKKQTPAEKKA